MPEYIDSPTQVEQDLSELKALNERLASEARAKRQSVLDREKRISWIPDPSPFTEFTKYDETTQPVFLGEQMGPRMEELGSHQTEAAKIITSDKVRSTPGTDLKWGGIFDNRRAAVLQEVPEWTPTEYFGLERLDVFVAEDETGVIKGPDQAFNPTTLEVRYNTGGLRGPGRTITVTPSSVGDARRIGDLRSGILKHNSGFYVNGERFNDAFSAASEEPQWATLDQSLMSD